MTLSNSSFKNGLKGEELASRFFQNKGYSIVAHRYRCSFGEIDLIVQKDNNYKAIEVKFRKKFYQLHDAISNKQLLRIQESFLFFLQEKQLQYETISVDALFTYPPQKIIHIENCQIDFDIFY